MRRDEIHDLKIWFDGYVKNFYSDNQECQAAVIFKEKHTARVCRNIIRIGEYLKLEEGDLNLAQAVALFHDIGRFRQYQVYGTFNDRRSESHALIGVRELEGTGVLEGLGPEESNLIKLAVGYHSSFDLPEDLSGRLLLFTRLIRDADKLDILDTFTGYYTRTDRQPDTVLESGLPDTPGYSRVLAQNLLQRELCSYHEVKNFNDRKLLLLSWVYDINFRHTFSEILENSYIEKIISCLPDTQEIQAIKNCLMEYATGRLSDQPNDMVGIQN